MGGRLRGRWLLAAVGALLGTVTSAVIGLVVIDNRSCGADAVTRDRAHYVPLSTARTAYGSKLTITVSGNCP